MKKIRICKATIQPNDIVYALQTRNGTYLADGVVHHNCKVCNVYKNGNYQVYEPKIKRELGIDEVQKLWDKAYSGRKFTNWELDDMLKQIKKDYKQLIELRREKGWKC